jgi:hypothetical protein
VIVDVKGDVKVIRDGEEVTAASLRLRADDEIRTGDDSAVEIHFLDGTVIIVSSNCCISMNKIVEELTKEETFWARIWGRIREEAWRTWCQIRGKPWRIETPTVAVAVRGTEFTLEAAEDNTTTLTVLEGTVEFSDLAMTGSVLVGGYQSSVMSPGGTPSSPTSIDPAEIDRWWEWEDDGTEIPLGTPPAVAIIVVVVILARGSRT